MDDKIKHTLMAARIEIESLRRTNEILAAQSKVLDVFAAAFGLLKKDVGMGIDVVWKIDEIMNDKNKYEDIDRILNE